MKINNEIKIGLMVVGVLVILAALTIKTGNFKFSKKGYELKVNFNNVDGIDTNSPVRLNGLEVGVVKKVDINYDGPATQMVLTLWLEENARVKEGSTAYVKMMGFMGEKYIGLTFGDPQGQYLTPGAMIPGKDPADFDTLMADGAEIATQLKEISANINEHLKKNNEAIDRTLVNLDKTMANLTSITSNVDERLAVNKNHIDGIVANLNSTSKNLDELSLDLKNNPWKLLYRAKETK